MLILFDQATPYPLHKFLPGHIIKTAYQQGWSTLLNGGLLRVAEESGFDLYVDCRQESCLSTKSL
jgi:hypothetical protein